MLKILRYLPSEPEHPRSQGEYSRRDFLKVVSLGGAGFLVGCTTRSPANSTPTPVTTPVEATPEATALQSLNSFVKIGSDDRVTVVVKHAEFGQGAATGLTTLVAEELDADWEQMDWEFAPANAKTFANLKFGMQLTGGSSSIANSYDQMRKAGATARAMLVGAAAAQWGVPAEEITVTGGRVAHSSGKSSTFGALAAAAATVEPPAEPVLKDPKDFKLIGKGVRRLDVAVKTNGQATFTSDVILPGMLVAVVAHPPRFGGKVKSFDPAEALKVEGVAEVVEIPRGVAVVGKDFWSAKKGREALKVEWDFSQAESRGSDELMAYFKGLCEKEGEVARDDGDALGSLSKAGQVIEADYEFPFLAHATMEPLACVAEVNAEGCKIVNGAQAHTFDQTNVATALGLQPEQVEIKSVFGGGSFGRRAVIDSDYVVECATIAQALKTKAPVKLIWDRTDDLHGGRYRPMSYHRVRGCVEGGKIKTFYHRLAIQCFFEGTPMNPKGVDPAAVEGTRNLPYAIPNQRVEAHRAVTGVPISWWRSVGHTQNAYVTETFLDRLCHAAKLDPVEARRELLKDSPRHLGVLNLAVEKAGAPPQKEGSARGVAVHESFESFVAEVVDVHLEKEKVVVDRVVCAVDCGVAVNPDIIKAQMESGIVYGLSAALAEQITLKDGQVQQNNFDSYQVVRMGKIPAIEVHIVPSAAPPTGVGEPGLPPLAPALANAIFKLTGKWITRQPFKLEKIV